MMGQENLSLYELFQKLIAEERLDPALAERLLHEILEIIGAHYQE